MCHLSVLSVLISNQFNSTLENRLLLFSFCSCSFESRFKVILQHIFSCCGGYQKYLTFCIKDTPGENIPSNKTEAHMKSMNMYLWAISTLKQL